MRNKHIRRICGIALVAICVCAMAGCQQKTAAAASSSKNIEQSQSSQDVTQSSSVRRITTNEVAEKLYKAETESKEINAKIQKATTQAELNDLADQLYREWDDLMNFIWDIADVYDTDVDVQRNWLVKREEKAKAASSSKGGSMQTMEYYLEAAEITKARVYELYHTFYQ